MREDEHLRRLLEAQARRRSLMNLKQYNEGKAELPKSETETECENFRTRCSARTSDVIADALGVGSGRTLEKMRTIWQAAQSGDAAAR